MRPGRTTWICASVIVAASMANLYLRSLVPLNPIGLSGAFFDGGLFERLAVSLEHHDWLGKFDLVTLAKGPAYSIFAAAAHRVGISLGMAEQLTYLLASLMFAWCIRLLTRNGALATAAFVILAFEPANFAIFGTEVVRDQWYATVSLLFISSLFVVACLAARRVRLRWVLPLAVFAGISGGVFWMCREEGVWLLGPAAIILAGMPVVRVVSSRSLAAAWRERRAIAMRGGPYALAAAVFFVSFYAPVAYVKHKNKSVYGVSLITDAGSGAFPEAYAAWSRVRGVPLTDFVPINREQRRLVYAVSPAARELRSRLEDPTNFWAGWGCDTVKVCDDFAGGAEIWALREAAFMSGNYPDAPTFQRFSRRLADEINAACDDGRLKCSMKLPPSLQALQRASWPALLRQSAYWLGQLPVHHTVYYLYNVERVYPVPTAERAFIAQGISGGPRTQADAVREARRFEGRHGLFRFLGQLHRLVFLAMLPMAIVGVALALVMRRRRSRNPALWVLSASLAAGIVVRLLIFAVIETTQYFNDMRYQFPTRTFLLALTTAGAANLVSVLVDARRRARERRARGALTLRSAPSSS